MGDVKLSVDVLEESAHNPSSLPLRPTRTKSLSDITMIRAESRDGIWGYGDMGFAHSTQRRGRF